MTKLLISRGQLDELAFEVKKESPNEAVALLFGHRNNGDWVVERVMPVRNSTPSPYMFSIAPEDIYQAYLWADRNGVELVGIFHSHLGEPYPSSVDVKYMELNAVVWVIAGYGATEFRAYMLSGERVLEVDLVVIP